MATNTDIVPFKLQATFSDLGHILRHLPVRLVLLLLIGPGMLLAQELVPTPQPSASPYDCSPLPESSKEASILPTFRDTVDNEDQTEYTDVSESTSLRLWCLRDSEGQYISAMESATRYVSVDQEASYTIDLTRSEEKSFDAKGNTIRVQRTTNKKSKKDEDSAFWNSQKIDIYGQTAPDLARDVIHTLALDSRMNAHGTDELSARIEVHYSNPHTGAERVLRVGSKSDLAGSYRSLKGHIKPSDLPDAQTQRYAFEDVEGSMAFGTYGRTANKDGFQAGPAMRVYHETGRESYHVFTYDGWPDAGAASTRSYSTQDCEEWNRVRQAINTYVTSMWRYVEKYVPDVAKAHGLDTVTMKACPSK